MKKILLPYDFQEAAENALYFAIKIAQRLKGNLVLFHSKNEEDTDPTSRLELKAAELKKHHPSIEVEIMVTQRYFNSLTIEELFGTKNLALIIIGTIGNDAELQKKLFGTISSEVAEELSCPVLVIPHDVGYKKINKLAYASDLNFLEKELPLVKDFAQKFEAEILVFHVGPVFPDLGDVEKRNIKKEIELIKEKVFYQEISFHSEETKFDNQTHKGIRHFLDAHKPDVLVLFHDKRTGFDKYISLTEAGWAVTNLDIPVLIFPKLS